MCLYRRAGLAAEFAFKKISKLLKRVSAAQHRWVGAVLILAYLYLPAQRTNEQHSGVAGAGVPAQGTAGPAGQAMNGPSPGVSSFSLKIQAQSNFPFLGLRFVRDRKDKKMCLGRKKPFCPAHCTQNALANLCVCTTGCRELKLCLT